MNSNERLVGELTSARTQQPAQQQSLTKV